MVIRLHVAVLVSLWHVKLLVRIVHLVNNFYTASSLRVFIGAVCINVGDVLISLRGKKVGRVWSLQMDFFGDKLTFKYRITSSVLHIQMALFKLFFNRPRSIIKTSQVLGSVWWFLAKSFKIHVVHRISPWMLSFFASKLHICVLSLVLSPLFCFH